MAVVETSADHAAPPPPEGDAGESEMRDLEDLLSKLNPMAEEFVPPSLAAASPTAYAYYPTPTPSHVFPAVDGLAGPRPRVTPTNHLRSFVSPFPAASAVPPDSHALRLISSLLRRRRAEEEVEEEGSVARATPGSAG